MYSLRQAQSGKRVWDEVGADPQLAFMAQERKQRAVDAGVLLSKAEHKSKMPLTEAIASFLGDIRLTDFWETAETYGAPYEPWPPKAVVHYCGVEIVREKAW